VSVAVIPAILMDDDPILRTTSEPVEDWSAAKEVVADMVAALADRGGRGLAAIQIGVPLRILVVRHANGFLPMINPSLDRTLNRQTVEREGCLSVPPRKWGDVSRPAKCDATWFDLEAEKHSQTLTGEAARVFQHEFDHLNGVLITDRT
jgi:peptide deformylase